MYINLYRVRDYRIFALGLYRDYRGIYWGYIGTMDKKMENYYSIVGYILRLDWDSGLNQGYILGLHIRGI